MMRSLAEKLIPECFERGERLVHPSPTLNLITRGTVVRGGKPVQHYWGEDLIVSSSALRDNRRVMALTYVELATITRGDIFETLADFPESAKTIHVAAMKIAMSRAVQLISRFVATKGPSRAQRAAAKIQGCAVPGEREQAATEVAGLNTALANLGKDVSADHKEFHGAMRHINGHTPLRGFAREQRHSQDASMAEVARAALALESSLSSGLSTVGSGGRLMVNEDGQTVGSDGTIRDVSLGDGDDPKMLAVCKLREDTRRELAEIKLSIQELASSFQAGSAGGGAHRDVTPTAGSQEAGGATASEPPLRFGRRRQRVAQSGTAKW
jgi:hypothetical protein